MTKEELSMVDDNSTGKLQWACRRGMLELDMLLQPFAREVYPTLTPEQQALFRDLLTCQDNELFQWLVANNRADIIPRFTDLVEAIRNFTQGG
ncbi:MAG: succinate dehydrogenase assembly factor 2 [Gammaproteobacteria bacterium]|nr:succinate dehydrogenase assembly factor 2 [Gammaproteobacteria bacterium]MCP4475122.1 succinate dehydrogenase assembly factor 2 [Gammaproteobacteria bacterium]